MKNMKWGFNGYTKYDHVNMPGISNLIWISS